MPSTVAFCPPTATVAGVVVAESGEAKAGLPLAGWLLTGPSPFAYRITVCPACAGWFASMVLKLTSCAAATFREIRRSQRMPARKRPARRLPPH